MSSRTDGTHESVASQREQGRPSRSVRKRTSESSVWCHRERPQGGTVTAASRSAGWKDDLGFMLKETASLPERRGDIEAAASPASITDGLLDTRIHGTFSHPCLLHRFL